MKEPVGEYVNVFMDNGAVIRCKVVHCLSTQFTALHLTGPNCISFRFYEDRGRTWEDTE